MRGQLKTFPLSTELVLQHQVRQFFNYCNLTQSLLAPFVYYPLDPVQLTHLVLIFLQLRKGLIDLIFADEKNINGKSY